MIKVIFFARIREQLGVDTVEVDYSRLDRNKQVVDLISLLGEEKGKLWIEVLYGKNVIVAINQANSDLEQVIVDGDEIAFYPPVTGG